MKKTLKTADKLCLKSEFDYVRANGTKYVGNSMLMITASAPDGRVRCGVVCGKKYSNRAVRRNRARRLLWESFRQLKARIGPAHIVLIPRQRIAGLKQPEVQSQMNWLLKEAGLRTADKPE